jgi:hypothetical protein
MAYGVYLCRITFAPVPPSESSPNNPSQFIAGLVQSLAVTNSVELTATVTDTPLSSLDFKFKVRSLALTDSDSSPNEAHICGCRY